MPRKRKNGRKKKSAKSTSLNQDKVVDFEATFPFNPVTVSASISTTSVTEFNLVAANLGSRLGQILDGYEFWRLRRILLFGVFLPGATTAGATAGVTNRAEAYQWGLSWNPISNVDTTIPAGLNAQCEYPHFTTGSGLRSLRLSVGPSGCKQLVPWLTTSTGPDSALQSAGTVTVVTISSVIADASAVATIRLFARVHIQCKSVLDITVSPALREVKPNRKYSIDESGKVAFDSLEEKSD